MTHRTQQFPPWASRQLLTLLLLHFPHPPQQWLTCSKCILCATHQDMHLTHTISLHLCPAQEARHNYYFHLIGEDAWVGLEQRSACQGLCPQPLTILPLLFLDHHPIPDKMGSLGFRVPQRMHTAVRGDTPCPSLYHGMPQKTKKQGAYRDY